MLDYGRNSRPLASILDSPHRFNSAITDYPVTFLTLKYSDIFDWIKGNRSKLRIGSYEAIDLKVLNHYN